MVNLWKSSKESTMERELEDAKNRQSELEQALASAKSNEDEFRKLLWARELTSEGVAHSIVNALKPLFPVSNLDYFLAAKGASSVWQLRGLLLALPALPIRRGPLPSAVPPLAPAGVQTEIPAWYLDELKKALAKWENYQWKQGSLPVAPPAVTMASENSTPPPDVTMASENSTPPPDVTDTSQASPPGRDDSPTPPWARRVRRRLAAREEPSMPETGGPLLIPMDVTSTLAPKEEELGFAIELLTEAWAPPVS